MPKGKFVFWWINFQRQKSTFSMGTRLQRGIRRNLWLHITPICTRACSSMLWDWSKCRNWGSGLLTGNQECCSTLVKNLIRLWTGFPTSESIPCLWLNATLPWGTLEWSRRTLKAAGNAMKELWTLSMLRISPHKYRNSKICHW